MARSPYVPLWAAARRGLRSLSHWVASPPAICPPRRRGPGDLPAIARVPGAVTPEKTSPRASWPRVALPSLRLIEARSGRHLWAERYDRGLADVFAVQDDITRRIVEELDVVLTSDEQARFLR